MHTHLWSSTYHFINQFMYVFLLIRFFLLLLKTAIRTSNNWTFYMVHTSITTVANNISYALMKLHTQYSSYLRGCSRVLLKQPKVSLSSIECVHVGIYDLVLLKVSRWNLNSCYEQWSTFKNKTIYLGSVTLQTTFVLQALSVRNTILIML